MKKTDQSKMKSIDNDNRENKDIHSVLTNTYDKSPIKMVKDNLGK